MELTQEEYILFTGDSIEFDGEDWAILVEVAEARLASLLCFEEFPANPSNLLKQLLANFMCAVFRFQGNGAERVESKSVRNFTIRFASDDAASALAQVAKNYGDLIDNLSECDKKNGKTDLALKVECTDHRWHQGGW